MSELIIHILVRFIHSIQPCITDKAVILKKSTLTISESIVITIICFGLFSALSIQAAFSNFPDAQFSDGSNISGILIEMVLGALAISYLKIINFEIKSLYPKPDWRGTLQGILLYAGVCMLGNIIFSLFSPSNQSQVINFSFSGVSLASMVLLAMINGAFEEVFLLGVLTRGLRGFGLSIALGIPLFIRLVYHLYQGPQGVIWVGIFGLMLTLFYMWNMKLWPVVFAHILGDIVPMVFAQS